MDFLPLCFCVCGLFFLHFIIPFGKLGPPYLGKATAAARTALPSPTSACWVFRVFVVTHRTLTWTTRSLTCVRDHPYACVYIYTPTTSQYNMFDSEENLSQFVLVLLTGPGFEPPVFGSGVRRSANCAAPPPTLAVNRLERCRATRARVLRWVKCVLEENWHVATCRRHLGICCLVFVLVTTNHI